MATIENRAQQIHKKRPVKILFLEAHDPRVRNAVEIVKKRKIAEPVFIHGNDAEKKMETARKMLENGEADAVISGATHASALTLRASFDFARKDVKRVSGSFLMISPDKKRYLMFADCSAQPEPTSEQIAEIAKLTSETFVLLVGQKPKVALLSYSTHCSGKGLSPIKMQEALKIIRSNYPGLAVEGEVQADAALNPEIAKIKCASPVTANILIFPNLDAANIGYKLVEHLGGWLAVGPILQGLTRQINDLSRGCSVDEIVGLAAVTVLQVDALRKR